MDIGFKWKHIDDEMPEIKDYECSDCVLVIRDCGEGTLMSYSISRYRPEDWGESRFNEKWLDQESKGYRVVAWCYLPLVNYTFDNIRRD